MLHILSASQFNEKELFEIMNLAHEMEIILNKGGSEMARGKILAALFYEPSTRTRLSFESAMIRLGGKIISETNVNFSSITKGEVLADTIRIISGYADTVVLRSKTVGDALLASQYSSVPILNGGDGVGEHPTQALLDLYTIFKQFKLGQEPLEVSFVGDLKYGRTVHSLVTILRNFEGIKINFVAPKEIAIPEKYVKDGDEIFTDLSDEILKKSDVIYDTRLQKERFEDMSQYEKLKEAFVFDPEKVNKMKARGILMHPLPRVNEILQSVDVLPQAKYFEQAQNGVPIRMALIAKVLNLV